MRGLFINQKKSNCSIFESGSMSYECFKMSTAVKFDYLEIDKNSYNISLDYDLYVLNFHYITMNWFPLSQISYLRSLGKIVCTLVLEVLPDNPFACCPTDLFDKYFVLDPVLVTGDPKILVLPRPLEPRPKDLVSSVPDKITIGTFGFATPGKGIDKLIKAVDQEFDEALVRVNLPTSTFADHERMYTKFIIDTCRKVQKKPSIEVEFTFKFYTKLELIRWCASNTINCFMYDRNMTGLCATADQAITSGRPLAISKNPTFRHLYHRIMPYPDRSLKESIVKSTPEVEALYNDWSQENFVSIFDNFMRQTYNIS